MHRCRQRARSRQPLQPRRRRRLRPSRSARRQQPPRRCRSSAIRQSKAPRPKRSVSPPKSDATRPRRTRPTARRRRRPRPTSSATRAAPQRSAPSRKRRSDDVPRTRSARGRRRPRRRARRWRRRAACARSARAAAPSPRPSASRASAASPSTRTSRSAGSCAKPTSGGATCSSAKAAHADARLHRARRPLSEEVLMSSDIASEAAPAGLSGHAFSSLFQAVSGLRNQRALVAMLGCMFVGVIVSGLLVAMTPSLGVFAGLLAMIVWVVAVGTGLNAAGLLQMDHARGISPRSTADALVYGLMCIPKLIALALIFVAVELAVLIVIAVLLFICKIPFLGPLLFV